MSDTETTLRIPKASIYPRGDSDRSAWLVVETPMEVMALIEHAEPTDFIPVTLANQTNDWNGRTAYVRAGDIAAVSPPLNWQDDDA